MKIKNQTGIWIDSSKAIIISLNGGKEMIREIKSDIENGVHHHGQGKQGTFMGTHHVNDEKKFQERHKHEVDQFLDTVVEEIKTADELFVMGPAQLKIKLKSKIEDNHLLSQKLKGVAAADHLSLNQCVAEVKKFYQE